jgi:hypothetical protein
MIFLHIGLNKSGSSSIQAFCDGYRPVLLEQGVDYPAAGVRDGAHHRESWRPSGRVPRVCAAR